ncbi:MAG: ABC transporter substrate-binding protein, partial [Pirellulales bacterium]
MTDWVNQNTIGHGFYEPVRFNGFPEIKESVLAGHLPATFMVAPLAIKLRQDGAPIKIVYLGHRDGTAMMVHKDSNIHDIADLRGKCVAVPTRFSNQYLITYKALRDRGLSFGKDGEGKDVSYRELAPPDMPTALFARAIDAIIS